MSQHTERLGRLLGERYQVKRALGRGGMGEVVAAWDRQLEVNVAIKVLDHVPDLARYEREAKTLAKLRHPRIVRVLDAGTLRDGRHYYVMDLLFGKTLAAIVADLRAAGRVLDPKVAAYHATHMLDALHAAHEGGVVHRDVKLENMIVDRAGDLTLFDFGLALTQEVSGPLLAEVRARGAHGAQGAGGESARSALMGTPRYMAPELIRGHRADPRSDLYAAGVVLAWLLSGEYVLPTGDGSDRAILEAHLYDAPILDRARNPACPDDLWAVVRKLLCKDPAGRFETAEAAGDAVGEVLRASVEPEHVLARKLAKDRKDRRAREVYERHAGREVESSPRSPRSAGPEVRGGEVTKPLGTAAAAVHHEPARADVTKELPTGPWHEWGRGEVTREIAAGAPAPPSPLPFSPRPASVRPEATTEVMRELHANLPAAALGSPSPLAGVSARRAPSVDVTQEVQVGRRSAMPAWIPRRRPRWWLQAGRYDRVIGALLLVLVGYLVGALSGGNKPAAQERKGGRDVLPARDEVRR